MLDHTLICWIFFFSLFLCVVWEVVEVVKHSCVVDSSSLLLFLQLSIMESATRIKISLDFDRNRYRFSTMYLFVLSGLEYLIKVELGKKRTLSAYVNLDWL